MKTPPASCEWNPRQNRPAVDAHGAYDGCWGKITIIVGGVRNRWHLCDSCAVLPAFARLRKRVRVES